MTSKLSFLLGFAAVVMLFGGTSLQAAPEEVKDAPAISSAPAISPAPRDDGSARPSAPDMTPHGDSGHLQAVPDAAPAPHHDDGDRGPTKRPPEAPRPDHGTNTWTPAPQPDQAPPPTDTDEDAPAISADNTPAPSSQPSLTGQHYSMDDLANSMQNLDSADTSHSSMDDLANSMSEL